MGVQRNKTLDIYKGILIILVVVRHTLQYSVSDEGGVLTNFIWAVQMPGFMLVSGYFSARNLKTLKELNVRFIYSLQHYAMPFLSWFVLVDVCLFGRHERNIISGIKYLMTHVDSGLWFLWVVFILSNSINLCNYVLNKKGIVVAAMVVVACNIIFVGVGVLGGLYFFGVKYIMYYEIFYVFGWGIHKTENFWKGIWKKAGTTIVAVCICIYVSVVFNFDIYNTTDDIKSIIVRCIVGFAGNLLIYNMSSLYTAFFEYLRMNEIGRYTLEIYVASVYVSGLMVVSGYHSFFELTGFGNFLAALLLCVLFTGIIILTINSNKIFKLLLFGK